MSTVKKNNDNHGRRFWGCPMWAMSFLLDDNCHFFKWIDKDNYGRHASEVIEELVSTKEGLEEEVKKLRQRLERAIEVE
ncbi:DNA topoisomerase 3-alpha [Bienertia sinuspersici]